MKQRASRWLTCMAAASLLCSCASHDVPFNEADFTASVGPGSGSVKGQAFRTLVDDTTREIDHRGIVRLMPVNDYTTEIVQKKYWAAHRMTRTDPRFRKYVRKTRPDDDGNFAFYNVPPGNYYVSCHALWTHTETMYDADNNFYDQEVQDGQWLYNTVAVKNGQTAIVDSWNQGK